MDKLFNPLVEDVFGPRVDLIRIQVAERLANEPAYLVACLLGLVMAMLLGFLARLLAYWNAKRLSEEWHKRQLEAWRKGHDPYIVGAVIEEPSKFYGREETLTELIHALEAGNHMALYGERRIGKTSLLHQLAHRLEQTGTLIPVFVEMQGVEEKRFFLVLMKAVVKAVRERIDMGTLAIDSRPERYDSEDMADDLESVLDALQAKVSDSVCLVLLLDEADTMNGYDQRVQERLRGLLVSKEIGKHVKLVWSGQSISRDWKLTTSPWYNLFKREVRLGSIERDAAIRLIRQPVKGVYEYDDAAVARILEYSDSKPFWIQRLCSACVRHLLDTRRNRVTVDDVDAAHQALEAEYRQESTEPSAPVHYQVAPLAHQVAEKKADYKKDDAQ